MVPSVTNERGILIMNHRREPTVRAVVGRPSGWRGSSSSSSFRTPPERVACNLFCRLHRSPVFHPLPPPARAAATRLKLWLLAAAHDKLVLAKAISLQCSDLIFLELHLFPCERCSRPITTQLLASGQRLERGREVLYPLVPRHDDGSALTKAFLPAPGYNISGMSEREREREGGSCRASITACWPGGAREFS